MTEPGAAPVAGAEGGGAAPAPVPTLIPGAPAADPAAPAPVPLPWTEGFSEETLAYATEKGWDGAGAVLSSYQNLEKLTGLPPEQLLRLPSTPEDEAWGDVYGKLGRPVDAAGYDFPEFEVSDSGVDIAQDFREWAFEQGLSQRQARGVVDKFTSRMEAIAAARQEVDVMQAEKDMVGLKAEWGNAYTENVELGKRFALHFGLGEEGLNKLENALGTAGMMRFAAKVGRAMGESEVPPDEATGLEFGATPAAAKAKIAQLQGDKQFTARWEAGDKEALAEMTRLHGVAFPEQ